MKYFAARLGNTKLIAPMRSIYLERQTGILEIEGPGLKKRLYFVDGELYLRRSDLPLTKQISTYLDDPTSYQAGQAAFIHEATPGEGRSTGQDSDLGVLASMIGEHWTAWNATSCRFIKGLDTPMGNLVGPLPTARLLVAAARAARTEDEIVEQLGGIEASVVAVPDSLTPATSSITRSDEAVLLELCREPITLGEIVGRANGARPETLRALARLWVNGLLRPYTPDTAPPDRVEQPESPSLEMEEARSEARERWTRQIWHDHFRLGQDPFSLTPDPAFLFLSEGHSEALAALEVGLLERRGLTVLIGEVGTGKTTLLYSLLSDVGSNVETAFVANTTLSFDEILQSSLKDFGLEPHSTRRVDLLDSLNSFLLKCSEEGKTVALVVDEAHALSAEAFEGLRQLLNFETYEKKLLQILLVGQPELGARLRERGLRQVADRVAIRCHLHPLKPKEAKRYIEHRLESAGAVRRLFSRRAIDLIVRKSKRIPRSINALCHNSLLFAYARGLPTVSRSIAREAVRERRGSKVRGLPLTWTLSARAVIGSLVILAVAAIWAVTGRTKTPSEQLAVQEVLRAGVVTVDPSPVSMAEAPTTPIQDPLEPPMDSIDGDVSPLRITTVNLNLRSGPTLDDAILTTLPEGTEVLLLTDEGEWAIIRQHNQSGWVRTAFLEEALQVDDRQSAP